MQPVELRSRGDGLVSNDNKQKFVELDVEKLNIVNADGKKERMPLKCLSRDGEVRQRIKKIISSTRPIV